MLVTIGVVPLRRESLWLQTLLNGLCMALCLQVLQGNWETPAGVDFQTLTSDVKKAVNVLAQAETAATSTSVCVCVCVRACMCACHGSPFLFISL